MSISAVFTRNKPKGAAIEFDDRYNRSCFEGCPASFDGSKNL